MSDVSQVEAAIAQMLGNALYPASLGYLVNVKRGWPTESVLRDALAQSMSIVRVHAAAGMGKDKTRYPRTYVDQTVSAPTLTASVAGNVVTFGGVPAYGQFVGLNVGGQNYNYVVQITDTLDSIASEFAALVPNASASGNVLTLPITAQVPSATVTVSGSSLIEGGREEQLFSIITWAISPDIRDSIMQTIYPALAYNYRLALPDGTIATLMDIQASGPDDRPARASMWRRDIRCNYDYPVTYVQSYPPVTSTTLNIV